MSNDIINNSYAVGVGGRNLILNTLGKIYVKRQDRYYELDFQNLANVETRHSDIIIVETSSSVGTLEYPGDNKIIISKDGGLFYTSDGKISEFKFPDIPVSLDLNDLTVNGFITINSPEGTPPFVINSRTLIENLNAEYLGGLRYDSYISKDYDEYIANRWTFNDLYINGIISHPYNGTSLDFNNSSLTIDTIYVKNLIQSTDDIDIISNYIEGLEKKQWLSKQIIVRSSSVPIDDNNWNISINDWIDELYNTWQLPDDLTQTQWFNVFVRSNGTVRDLTQQIYIDEANAYLSSIGSSYKVEDFIFVFYDWFNVSTSTFNGLIYEIEVNENDISKIKMNDIVEAGNIVDNVLQKIIGIVTNIDVDRNILYIKLQDDDEYNIITNGRKLVIVDHFINPQKKGGVYFESIDELPNYINIDEKLGKLNTRLGRLDSTSEDVFGKMNGIGVFFNGTSDKSLEKWPVTKEEISEFGKNNHSQIFVKNAHISQNNVSLLNPDGSGHISNDRLIWTKDNLKIGKNNPIIVDIDGNVSWAGGGGSSIVDTFRIVFNNNGQEDSMSLDGCMAAQTITTGDFYFSGGGLYNPYSLTERHQLLLGANSMVPFLSNNIRTNHGWSTFTSFNRELNKDLYVQTIFYYPPEKLREWQTLGWNRLLIHPIGDLYGNIITNLSLVNGGVFTLATYGESYTYFILNSIISAEFNNVVLNRGLYIEYHINGST